MAEKNIGELFVVMLAGVHQDSFDLRMPLHLVHQGSDFRKVGTRSDDIQDFQALTHGLFVPVVRTKYSIR